MLNGTEERAPDAVEPTPVAFPRLPIAALLAGVPFVIGAAALALGGFIGVSVAIAAGMLGLYGGSLGARRLAADPAQTALVGRLARWAPPLIVAAVAVAMTWPFPVDPPITHDHPVHMTRAWHFVHEMLGEARLSGWSDLWFAGWPAGEDYPPGGDMWVSLFHLATFGALGIERAYGLAMTGLFVLLGLSAYTFGRVYFGRTAGLIAGLLFLLDPGAYREGGWSYTLDWGVWPQTLSMAWTFFAFAAMEPLVRRGRALDVARVGALTGAALLSHPVAVILLGLGVPIYVFVQALAAPRGEAGKVIVRLLGAVALGGTLAAFWLVPFMSKSVWMARYGDLWLSLEDMGAKAWTGGVFQNMAPPILWLGAAGAWVGLRRQLPASMFLALLAGLLLLLGSSTVFEELGLLSLSPTFGQVQFQRLGIGAKAAVFLLAGHGIAAVLAGVREQAPSALSWSRRYVIAGLVALVAAPFVMPMFQAYAEGQAAELGGKEVLSERPDDANYEAMLQWLRDRRDAETDAFWRVAFVRPYNDHYFAAATIHTGVPSYKAGFTPCTNFRHKPDTMDPALLEAVSVKYAVATRALSTRLFARVATFGSIRIYRFKHYNPQRYTLEGPGAVAVERFAPGDGEMRLRISGAGPDSRLILHVANFANWRATLDGEPVPIETAALGNHEHFIGAAARDGLLVVSYVTPAVNRLAGLASWLGILALVLLFAARRRPGLVAPVWRRIRPLWAWVERRGVVIACVLALLPVAGVAAKVAGREAGGETLADALPQAQVSLVRGGATTPCPPDLRARHRCDPERSWNYVGAVVQKLEGGLRRCIWAHPVADAELVVTFPAVTADAVLTGHHGFADAVATGGGAPVSLEVRADGQVVGRAVARDLQKWQPFSLDTAALAGREVDLTFVVTAARDGGRHYCFDARFASEADDGGKR